MNRHLSTEGLEGDLARRSVRSGAAVWAMQIACAALRLGTTMVLARWLAPADFGLVAMATAFAGLLGLLRSMGLPSATLQRAELDSQQVSALFWINTGLGLATALAIAAGAPALAAFYDDPRLVAVTIALACASLLEGAALQHQALLRRQMRFAPLATIEVVAHAVGAASALGAAALGAGYWALVAQVLGRSAVSTLGAWRASGWRPAPVLRAPGLRPLLAFGAQLAAADFLSNGFRSLTDLLIGRFAGAAGLGLFSRATALQTFSKSAFSSPLDLVAIGGLSRLQGQPERYRRYFARALLPPVTLGMPLVAFLFVAAEPLVATVLGPQWPEVVPLFRWLAPIAFLGTFNAATSWVLVSTGRSDRSLRWTAVSTAIRLVALLASAPFGLVAMAGALSGSTAALRPLAIAYALHDSPLRPADVYRVLWRPTAASLLSALLLAAVLRAWPLPEPAPIALGLAALVYAPLYLAAWLVLPGGAARLREQVGLLRHLRGGRPALARVLEADGSG